MDDIVVVAVVEVAVDHVSEILVISNVVGLMFDMFLWFDLGSFCWII